MAEDTEKVSHLKIYEELITLRTEFRAFIGGQPAKADADKRRDDRLDAISARVNIGLGICLVLSLLVPIIVAATAPRLHFGQQVEAQDERRP
jgi:hypothetical protein